MLQRFRETVPIAPTWAMRRCDFAACGGFDTRQAEDLRLVYQHTRRGGTLAKATGGPFVVYRYHQTSASGGVSQELILEVRVRALVDQWLGVAGPRRWQDGFSIWNAGKDGKKLLKLLPSDVRSRVRALGDVDPNKIGRRYIRPEWNFEVPVVHFSDLEPPVLLCVKLDTTGGAFEANVRLMAERHGWVEGEHYLHFA